jgi:thiol-disulfide isomerase/thioredoxin
VNEFSELQRAHQAYGDKGVGFIGVFVRGSDDEIRKFAEAHKITFPVGKENGIANLLGVQSIPTTVFIGKDGRIVKRHRGQISYTDLDANIRTILK